MNILTFLNNKRKTENEYLAVNGYVAVGCRQITVNITGNIVGDSPLLRTGREILQTGCNVLK